MLVIAAANVYVHDFKIPAAGFKHFLAIAAQYDAIAAQYDVDACTSSLQGPTNAFNGRTHTITT